jgi:hypothetical protein
MLEDLNLTVLQILDDDKNFKNHLINCFNNYLKIGTLRTSDSILNNDLFLK